MGKRNSQVFRYILPFKSNIKLLINLAVQKKGRLFYYNLIDERKKND